MSKQKPWNVRTGERQARALRSMRRMYLIVTEGETEAAYLRHFRTTTGPDVVPVSAGAGKLGLVKLAIEERAQRIKSGRYYEDRDETWVAMDRDVDPSNPHDKMHFNEALSLAEREGIRVALSNDSFELWYLLHFQEVTSPMHRRDIDKKLSEHIGRTYKSRHGSSKTEDLFIETYKNIELAMERAVRLEAAAKEASLVPVDANPTTTVPGLISAIMNEEGFSFSKIDD